MTVASVAAYGISVSAALGGAVASATLGSGARRNLQWELKLDPRNYGARCDGRVVTDCAVSGSLMSSATAEFAAADQGKAVVVDGCPSSPGTGTVSVTNGSLVVTGTGTHFLSEYVANSNNDDAGANIIWIDGAPHAINFVVSDTDIRTMDSVFSSGAGKAHYRQGQLVTTIAAFVSRTQVALASSAPVAVTGVEMCFGTIDTDAMQECSNDAVRLGGSIVAPLGIVCLAGNIAVANADFYNISGVGMDVTTFRDMRALSSVARIGANYGLFSINDCGSIAFKSMTFRGSMPDVIACSLTTTLARKAIYVKNADRFTMRDVLGTRFRDEAFYANNVTAVDWQSCQAIDTNTNGFNPNSLGVGSTLILNNNRMHDCGGNAILAVAESAIVCHNHISADRVTSNAAVLAPLGGVTFSRNVMKGINTTNAGAPVAYISMLGGVAGSAHTINEMCDNQFIGCSGYFDAATGEAALILLENVLGPSRVAGNTTVDCGVAPGASPGRFIRIAGANTGPTVVGANVHVNASGLGTTVGVAVDATVPVGAVTVLPSNVFTNVSIPWMLGAAISQPGASQTISAAGATAVTPGVTSVYVTANGAVAPALPSPVLVGARFRVTIMNKPTQAGTTTVSTAAGLIDGAATTTIVAANKAKTFESDGANWQTVGVV